MVDNCGEQRLIKRTTFNIYINEISWFVQKDNHPAGSNKSYSSGKILPDRTGIKEAGGRVGEWPSQNVAEFLFQGTLKQGKVFECAE